MFGDILEPTHLLFILVVALLVLGPKRLPEVGKTLGSGLRDFRQAISGEASPMHDWTHQMSEAVHGETEHSHEPSTEPADPLGEASATASHDEDDGEPVVSATVAADSESAAEPLPVREPLVAATPASAPRPTVGATRVEVPAALPAARAPRRVAPAASPPVTSAAPRPAAVGSRPAAVRVGAPTPRPAAPGSRPAAARTAAAGTRPSAPAQPSWRTAQSVSRGGRGAPPRATAAGPRPAAPSETVPPRSAPRASEPPAGSDQSA